MRKKIIEVCTANCFEGNKFMAFYPKKKLNIIIVKY